MSVTVYIFGYGNSFSFSQHSKEADTIIFPILQIRKLGY